MIAATERAGHLAFKSSSQLLYRLRSVLVGSSFLALCSVFFCLLFLVMLGFVAIGLSPISVPFVWSLNLGPG
jgi:hypothetical protein